MEGELAQSPAVPGLAPGACIQSLSPQSRIRGWLQRIPARSSRATSIHPDPYESGRASGVDLKTLAALAGQEGVGLGIARDVIAATKLAVWFPLTGDLGVPVVGRRETVCREEPEAHCRRGIHPGGVAGET